MQGFASDYLANLVADLTTKMLTVVGRGLKETLAGTEQQQALQRCVQAGALALTAILLFILWLRKRGLGITPL